MSDTDKNTVDVWHPKMLYRSITFDLAYNAKKREYFPRAALSRAVDDWITKKLKKYGPRFEVHEIKGSENYLTVLYTIRPKQKK